MKFARIVFLDAEAVDEASRPVRLDRDDAALSVADADACAVAKLYETRVS